MRGPPGRARPAWRTVSSSAKPTAMSTSIASQCCREPRSHAHAAHAMSSRPCCPGRQNLRPGQEPTKVACRRGRPSFRRAGPYRRPCRAAPPLACNGHMHTEPELTQPAPQLGRYDIDPSALSCHVPDPAPVRARRRCAAPSPSGAAPWTSPSPSTGSAIYAEIDTASFRTASSQRDRTVLSPRFLNPARYPVMIFSSGRLDVRGQVAHRHADGARHRAGRSAFPSCITPRRPGSFTARATTRIDRTEFGVTAMRGLAGPLPRICGGGPVRAELRDGRATAGSAMLTP